MALFEKIELPTVKHIIVVASGKGGVGKSTVSCNLATGLVRKGFKTALVDADIYGPSIPKMMGVAHYHPTVETIEGKELMLPAVKEGVKIMSIGFFVEQNKGLIWRGPMASSAITQLLENTLWGEIDYMVVDFPPGTGDIQLTSVQKLSVSGALIVTTPQEVAVNDARKAANMFSHTGIKVPILGIIENMSWFTPQTHPDEKYFLFGKGGGALLAQEYKTILLGQLPLIAEIGEAAEHGQSGTKEVHKSVLDIFDKIVTDITSVLVNYI